MMTLKWYAHGYQNPGDVAEALGTAFMSDESKKVLVQELLNAFYEVKFDIEVNEMTGKIMSIKANV